MLVQKLSLGNCAILFLLIKIFLKLYSLILYTKSNLIFTVLCMFCVTNQIIEKYLFIVLLQGFLVLSMHGNKSH